MIKINLNNYIESNHIDEMPTKLIKEINGGCTKIVIGRCLKDGSYYFVTASGTCGNYSSHRNSAFTSARNSYMKNGQFYNWPDGTITG